MRVVAVCALLCALLVVAVSAVETEDQAPVPEGFSLPNIFNPVMDHPYGRSQAKRLVHLVAKEPKIAFDVGGPEAPIEDMWNGEKDPVSSASVAQLKMLKEVDSLTKLIDQGKKILRVLPRKQKRLALLKAKLSHILDAKAKKEASEKLDQQQALLHAIKKRESKMSSRLKALKTSQSKLQGSVVKLQKVLADPKKAKRKAHKKARKQQRKQARKQHKKHHRKHKQQPKRAHKRAHKQGPKQAHRKHAHKQGHKQGRKQHPRGHKQAQKHLRRGPNGEPLPQQNPAAPQQQQQQAGAPHPRFAQMNSEAEMEQEADMEAEQEAELDQEAEMEGGMEMEGEMEGEADMEGEMEADNGMEAEAGMGMEQEAGMEAQEGDYMY